MADSLFISPSFILTEVFFIIVASIAAYELIIGDFIWAQQAEARRNASMQNRGREYGTFESPQQQQGGYRSLSPGGRGRGLPRQGQQRGSNNNNNMDGTRGGGGDPRTVTEEGYYSSPGDPRFASPGRGSSGDTTRRLFYKFILLALLSRFILLPVETFCFTQTSNTTMSSNFQLDPILLQILLRLSQTLPDIIFASALGLLIIFCAQIAFAAMPPLTPQSGEASIHDEEDTSTIEEGTAERDSLLGAGEMKGQDNIEGKQSAIRLMRSLKFGRTLCIAAARLSRTILASKKTFTVWNIALATSYILVFVASLILPQFSASEITLWIVMVTIYSFLLLSLIYVTALLGTALYPGIVRRKNVDSLALRLVGTCTLLAIMLINRVVWFSIVAHGAIDESNNHGHDERIPRSYRRSSVEYVVSEPLPILFILYMMHRKRKEVQNDVLIIHSIMNNLFGSSTQLDNTTNMTAAQGDGSGNVGARGGGLGSRRFQTYGGSSRGDSFPPTSGTYKPQRNIPRAVSSSGGSRPKQQP